mmetsp:Transcript_3081/g.3431  ORF Transcript_3081/g.3431 Transcript_3081/m.3431 type:complete len:125 (+) Transcript_3081:28-402(+)|eukprot:CAMPEP_0168537318 /NCGR_PEP_ID=MMETSP0405-20121227/20238_1 /TAXON_ID=498012 /ORGANISM="Trichosphaerium sp, Strain Am-I-7 wt" /LENGTH=124 /DNA_ID=CAMNT_0008565821 /DNA_START=28 /DNA_END=402 /DNA_ORIENTATION=+
MGKQQLSELRTKTPEELKEKLDEYKQELCRLRVAQVTGTGGQAKLAKIRTVRKSIAQVFTIISENQRENLKKYYKNSRYVPYDLQPTLSRKLRRKLTNEQVNLRTKREQKRINNFPLRKYAVTS